MSECICDICGASFLTTSARGSHRKYCYLGKPLSRSRRIYAKRGSEEFKQKVSAGILKAERDDPVKAEKCQRIRRENGKKINHHLNFKTENDKRGGLRHGGGRGKKGWFEDFWCDSSWELAYVLFCRDHSTSIERNKKGFEYTFEGETRKYYPDFIVEGKYIEIKGYITGRVQAKINQFPEKLTVLGRQEIQPYLEYAIEKYGQNYIELYRAVC